MNKKLLLSFTFMSLFYRSSCFNKGEILDKGESFVEQEQVNRWINVEQENPVQTVFFQGIFASQAQAAKYMGRRGFIATTGEFVVCLENSIDAIHTLSVAPELEEVVLDTSLYGLVRKKGYFAALGLYPLYQGFYARGLIDNYINGTKVVGKKFKRETVKGYAIQMSLMNIGQEGDVKDHQKKMELAGSGDKILYGVSRGSAVSFVAYALNHTSDQYKNVKLVVLEGAFDAIEQVIRHRHSLIAKYTFAENFLYDRILHRFTQFKRSGISPISVVAYFPKDTPVLFITSAIDKNVSSACAKNLAHALVQSGHKQVYIGELKNSSHTGYTQDNPEDVLAYQTCLHTMYKYYNLPYIPEYAVGSIEDYLVC